MKQQYLNCDELINNIPLETIEILGSILSELNKQRDRSPWYKLKEAAEYLRCSVTTIRRLIDEGTLKSNRIDQQAEKSTILILEKIWTL